jgi:hypothetical protein
MSNPHREQSLEGDMLGVLMSFGFTRCSSRADANVMKVTEPERARRLCEGEKP